MTEADIGRLRISFLRIQVRRSSLQMKDANKLNPNKRLQGKQSDYREMKQQTPNAILKDAKSVTIRKTCFFFATGYANDYSLCLGSGLVFTFGGA